MSVVLGVDTGNTKTVAVVATDGGSVVGYARAGAVNIYASVEAAGQVLHDTSRRALEMAGVTRADYCALSATGADWPEDFALLYTLLREGALTQNETQMTVINDAVGALWTGAADGQGVAVAVGTSAGTGARRGRAVWHSSYWQETEGAVQLGQKTLSAIYRASLGLAPETSLSARVLTWFGLESAEALLHAFTSRTAALGERDTGRLARILLDEAEGGDAVAQQIVTAHADALGRYAVVAARKVGFTAQPFPLVLTGGVTRHGSALFRRSLVNAVTAHEPGATLSAPAFEPVGGAVCEALAHLGVYTHEARCTLASSLPEASFYET